MRCVHAHAHTDVSSDVTAVPSYEFGDSHAGVVRVVFKWNHVSTVMPMRGNMFVLFSGALLSALSVIGLLLKYANSPALLQPLGLTSFDAPQEQQTKRD
jgi:hypothetical protein